MPDFAVMHFHNPADGKAEALGEAFAGPHLARLRQLRGFTRAQRFAIAPTQLMPGAQPWTNLTAYEFTLDQPEMHLPALASPLADLRDAGLIASDGTERVYCYGLYSPWKFSTNLDPAQPFSHMMVLLANVTAGQDAEYHQWYDDVHSVEVTNTPGYVGMKRGELLNVPVAPVHYCPGSQLILGAMQTDDLPATFAEFIARANGQSSSGTNWGPRPQSASVARTVHIFASVQGPFEA
jgi:hypothetical protein